MKKFILSILAVVTSFMFITNVYAASASFTVGTSSNQVIVGKTVTVSVTVSSSSPLGAWEYTLNYNPSVFKLTSSDVGLHYASYASNENTKSVTYRYTFQALTSGTANFYVDSSSVVGFDENVMSVNNGSRQVKAITYTEYQNSLSKNNNLKSLTIEGAELDPEFNKDTLEYSVKVSEDVKSVKITAVPEDGTATISGAGEHEVSPGNNVIDIVVIAQNGSEKTYKVNVEVIDKDPINVEVGGKKYTVVKIAENLVKPASFQETTIKIDEFDIPAYYSEITHFTLVGLKNEEGDISLYIYEDGKYTKYVELTFGNLTIYPLPMEESIKEYTKNTVKIFGENIECLEASNSSRFKIIYGLNVETGEEGLYQYDTEDGVAIRYDEEAAEQMNNKIKMLTMATIAFIGSTILALVGLIASLAKKGKKKEKKEKNFKMPEPTPAIEEAKKETKEEQPLGKTQKIEKVNKTQKIDLPKIEVTDNLMETDEDEVYDIFADDRKRKKKKKEKKTK